MQVALAYALCALVWGTTWFAIRVCIGPGGYPTFAAAALRFTLAAFIMLPVLLIRSVRPAPRGLTQWLWLVAAGVLNATGYALVYVGEEQVAGGLAAVLFGTEPLAVAFLVTVTGTERVSRAEIAGALVALGGIAIIFMDRLSVSVGQAVGIVLIATAVVITGLHALIVKLRVAEVHPLATSAIFLTVTAVVLWMATLGAGWKGLPSPLPFKPTLALVYLSVFGSVIAFGGYFYLLRRVSLMTVSTLVFILPVVALGVDALFEEARLVLTTYVGVAVTLCGVAISLLLRPPRGPEAPAAPATSP